MEEVIDDRSKFRIKIKKWTGALKKNNRMNWIYKLIKLHCNLMKRFLENKRKLWNRVTIKFNRSPNGEKSKLIIIIFSYEFSVS